MAYIWKVHATVAVGDSGPLLAILEQEFCTVRTDMPPPCERYLLALGQMIGVGEKIEISITKETTQSNGD